MLTLCAPPGELVATSHPVLSVFAGEGDAKAEGCVGDVVVEVVLLPDAGPLHVVHVNFHDEPAHAFPLVDHLLPHLEYNGGISSERAHL